MSIHPKHLFDPKVEYYTPAFIIEAARSTMGSIDLDVASCEEANKIVKATKFFTKEQNAFKENWSGNIWMNHPFDRFNNEHWIIKLVSSFERGNVTSFCCITFASTSEAWFIPLMKYPQCFLFPRTKYISPGGKQNNQPPKGSVVTYGGNNLVKFKEQFSKLGVIKV